MKIDNSNVGGLNLNRTGTTAPTSRYGYGSGSSDGYGSSSDQISLSSLSQQLRTLDVSSPERDQKIQSLQAAYAKGTYQPDPAVIAKSMVTDATQPFL